MRTKLDRTPEDIQVRVIVHCEFDHSELSSQVLPLSEARKMQDAQPDTVTISSLDRSEESFNIFD